MRRRTLYRFVGEASALASLGPLIRPAPRASRPKNCGPDLPAADPVLSDLITCHKEEHWEIQTKAQTAQEQKDIQFDPNMMRNGALLANIPFLVPKSVFFSFLRFLLRVSLISNLAQILSKELVLELDLFSEKGLNRQISKL